MSILWTTPKQLRAHVDKLWSRGQLLAALCAEGRGGGEVFPLRIPLKVPDSRALSDDFAAVRVWSSALLDGAAVPGRPGYRVVLRSVRHRIIGSNDLPAEVWLDTPDDAFALIGRRAEAERFCAVLALVRAREPVLEPWLTRRPLKALELAEHWPRLLDMVAWLRAHPRSGCYLRQVDLPGVDTKFIEQHQGVLAELFDLALAPHAIDPDARGQAGFSRRYGFRNKPERVRVRFLDPTCAPLPALIDHDLSFTAVDFARLRVPVQRVFITENEINFLAFPPHPESLLILGGGYGFSALADAEWLKTCALYYWGDIDTHGFAILSQLRSILPHARSLLMDYDTLIAHREQWGFEASPSRADLSRLTAAEAALFADLRDNRFGEGVRLEQERIAFGRLAVALVGLFEQ